MGGGGEPDRIAYSPINRRPRLQWPHGARGALRVVPNVEYYERNLGENRKVTAPMLVPATLQSKNMHE